MILPWNIDKKIEELGYTKEDYDEKYGAIYHKTEPENYLHTVHIMHKASGRHLIQSYTNDSAVVGLTFYETLIFYKKAKQLERKWKRNKNGK